jgi:ATP-binding cassette subfamily F protein 3
MILVSHDRWLLGQVTDHTLDVKRSGVVEYPGDYDHYRNRTARTPPPKRKDAAPEPIIPKLLDGSSQQEEPLLSPRELSKEIQRVEKLVGEIEVQVSEQEEALRLLEAELADLPATADVYALTSEHQRLKESIEGAMAAWEEQAGRLERLRALQG